MIKKVLLGAFMLLLSAGMVYGAINRTVAQSQSGINPQDGRGSSSSEVRKGQQQNEIEIPRERLNQNQNEPRRSTDDIHQSGYEDKQLITLEGVVIASSDDSLEIGLLDNTLISMTDRAWRYALENGFTASVGQPVQVTGFEDDEHGFEAVEIINLETGNSVQLREEKGRPNWAGAGQGNRGNRGG